ncbi:hypothetical protein ACFLZ0_00410 [Patescibacteria group bacterium]
MKEKIKKILKGVGLGSAYVSGGILLLLVHILQFLVTAIIGLGVIFLAISKFLEGSIIVGILILLIVAPLAIAFAHWAFIYLSILAVFSAIIWGITNLFGFSISFSNAYDITWLIIAIILLGFLAFIVIGRLIEAIREKKIINFFKETWFYILLFFFFLWMFF